MGEKSGYIIEAEWEEYRKKINCPNCKSGRLFPAIPHENFPIEGLPCDICNGTGILPKDIMYDPEHGKRLKDDRMHRTASLRVESIVTGIDVAELSRRERGYFHK